MSFVRRNLLGLLLALAPLWALAYDENDIPARLREWARLEQLYNDRSESRFLKVDPENTGIPPEYDPMKRGVFEIGHIEIPADEAKAQVLELGEAAKKMLVVKRDGKTFYRMFIHPMMEKAHAKAIRKYGLKKGEYLATATSSPRSLWVWDKNNHDLIVGQKVSLGVEIGGVSRLNPTDKLNRAIAATAALSEISEEKRAAFHFDIIPESMTIEDPDKSYGTITRDFREGVSHPNGKPKFVAGTSLLANGPGGEPAMLARMIRESGVGPEEFLEKKILRPMIQSYAYLMFHEGFSSEPHVQNLLFELDENGRLTGKVVYRDMDSFKADLELRNIRGKSTEAFRNYDLPQKTLKLNKATEYYDDSYRDYLRGAWGERLEKMLEANRELLSVYSGRSAQVSIYEMFDRLMAVETTRHMGSDFLFRDRWPELVQKRRAQLEQLFPDVNWDKPKLTAEQIDVLIQEMWASDVFGATPNQSAPPFKLNELMERHKQDIYDELEFDARAQARLKKEYERLRFNHRTLTQVEPPEGAKYLLRNGNIEVFDKNRRHFSIGLLEPESMLGSRTRFYADVEHPRKEPKREVLKKLIDDGKKTPKARAPAAPEAMALAEPVLTEAQRVNAAPEMIVDKQNAPGVSLAARAGSLATGSAANSVAVVPPANPALNANVPVATVTATAVAVNAGTGVSAPTVFTDDPTNVAPATNAAPAADPPQTTVGWRQRVSAGWGRCAELFRKAATAVRIRIYGPPNLPN